MQPDHLGAERDRFGKQLRIRRQRNVQAGPHQIGLEARGERRVRHHGGEIGHHVFGLYGLRKDFCQMREQRRFDVWLGRGAVGPEWMSTATE